MKRFLAVLLCLLMCVSMLPVTVFAEEADIMDEDEIEEHEHSMEFVSAVEPSFKPGHIAYYYCADCGGMYADADGETELADADIILAAIHTKPTDSKKIKMTPATCTRNGKIEYTCADEGCNMKGVEVIPAHGVEVYHAENQATCFANGNIEYYQCSECGRIYADAAATQELQSIVVPALTHSLVKVEARNATCAACGNIEHWKCEYCGTLFADAAGTETTTAEAVATSKLPHTLIKTDAHDATCDTDGNIEYWTCSGCGGLFLDEAGENAVEAEAVVIEKLGHDLEEVPAKSACLEDGNTQYWVCKRENCGKVFSDAEGTKEITLTDTVIPAIGHHDFNGGLCTVCKVEDPSYKGPSFKDTDLTYTPGQPLIIRIDADYETSIENNWSVTINGVTIDPAFIVVSEGSTVLTVSEEGMKKAALHVGEDNNVTVQLKQGTVSGPLTVRENPAVIIDSTIPNGSVSADNTTPGVGATVTLTVAPDEEYALKPGSLSVKDENNSPLTVSKVSGTNDKFTFTMPAFDVTVTAEFVGGFTVSFNANGHGTAPDNQTVISGGKATQPPDPIADGYRFDGWYKEVACTSAFDFNATVIESNTTIYAKWTQLFKVTYDPVIPVEVTYTKEQTVASGEKVPKPTDPKDSPQHHTFLGWYKESGYSTKFDFDKETISKDITLYAKWTHDYPHDSKDALEGKGICPYCWEADHSFTTGVKDPDFTAEIVRGNGKTAHYGSYFPMTVNTYYRYVKGSVEVKVDGKTLSADKYTVYAPKHGTSTVVELERAYVRSLPVGKYAISIKTNLGTAKGFFWVSSSPKTADDSNVALYVTVGVISAAAVAGIAYYLIKKRRK